MEIKANFILKSNKWNEPVRVVKVEDKGGYMELYAEGSAVNLADPAGFVRP